VSLVFAFALVAAAGYFLKTIAGARGSMLKAAIWFAIKASREAGFD